MEGLSTSRHCHPFANCLANEAKRFVIRYYSRETTDSQKRLSPKEAAELARAGLEIATVYQDNGRLTTDFGEARGVRDGISAQQAADAIGQPPGSAIYFAVDSDFSASQVLEFVVPYFRGVKRGLDQAAGGTSTLDIGVYGSGLACQLVRDNFALARYAWLALSSKWEGTATYEGWDVRQHAATGDLCGLGKNWERCEAPGAFGAFRPIGFQVTAGAGEEMWVTAPRLNLRWGPSTTSNPPITQLLEGQKVRVLGPAANGWLRVRATVASADVIGYASASHLAPLAPPQAPEPPPPGRIPAVHYRENDPRSRRASVAKRAQPLGETPRPHASPEAPGTQRAGELRAIVDWLDVEQSARYQPSGVTFCNVYATDYCYLAGVYLPRVWWTASALMQIATGASPPVLYGTTVREMRADDLYAWLAEFGSSFGWQRVFDVTALQEAANAGGVGVIVADRLEAGRPGHITVVVPESAGRKAQRDADGLVLLPLQSQAGARNLACGTIGSPWWNDQKFADEDGFFIHA